MANEFKLSYTAADINTRLGRIDSLAEKSELPKKLSDLTNDSDFATKDYVQNNAQPKGDYALKSDIPTDYLTEIPSEYVTETELNAKGYLTEHQSLEGLATQEYVEESLAKKQPIGDYVLKSEIPTGGSAIIDVAELPTEDIREDCFYRLMSAYLIYNQFDQRDYDRHCRCVDTLPSVGEPVTTNMEDMIVYYNISDGDVYGYITDALGSGAGVPAGWYTIATLAPLFDVTWNGVITDINDDPQDASFRLLLFKDFYIYQDGWCKIPFACEKEPEFDIQWDGEIGDRFALDLSSMGLNGVSYVKICDDVFAQEQLIGATWTESDGCEYIIEEYNIDTTTYLGAIAVGSGVIIAYASDDLNAALGLPSGYLTDGTYFQLTPNYYTNRLVAPSKVVKIDSKYVDVDLDDVYSKSEVDMKISQYAKTTEVKTMISNAIGTAIGGSY